MSEKFHKTTWTDMCQKPFPLKWYRDIFNLHHYTMDEKALDYWDEYKKTQYLSPKNRQEYIDKKIVEIVTYAYNHIPYYKELYDTNGVDIKKIKGEKDLEKLPLIDKDTLTMGIGKLSAEHHKATQDTLLIKTSGSTGVRMSFTCDKEQLNRRWAVWMRLFEWSGWEWGKKEFRFWFKLASTVKDPQRESFDAYLSNRHFFDFNHLDDEELLSFCKEITTKQPYVITGYWEAIEAIAKFAFKNKISFKVPAVLPSTQITTPSGRKMVEKVFNTTILDKYASAEFSGIGHQCEKSNLYHIQSENVFVEILKDGKRLKEGVGEAVITDLSNKSTPLIRYRVGDVLEATEQQCTCKKTLPVFKKPHGRIKNLVKIDSDLFTELQLAEFEFQMWEKDICERVKFVQSESGVVNVLVAKLNNPEQFKKEIKKLTGEPLNVIPVEAIDHFRGKRHRGESKIKNPFNN